jgi:hypothetical protein
MRREDQATAAPRSATWASRLVVLFGFAVAANWVVAMTRDVEPTGADLSFTVLMLVVTGLLGYGLNRLARWAWFLSLVLAALGLFFVAPIIGTMMLGGGLEPIGTGWDVFYFPLLTVILVALLILLPSVWREMQPRS